MINKCPNPECGQPCELKSFIDFYRVVCTEKYCYQGPSGNTKESAIRKHNALAAPTGTMDAEVWRNQCWDAAQAAMSKWTGLTEQHRHEIACDVVEAFSRLAPSSPVASLTAQQAAEEIWEKMRHLPVTYDARPEIASIISRVAQGWQPIESAPHTGIAVLLWRPWKSGYDTTCIGHYANGWVIFNDYEGRTDWHPTHWMPLPAAPGESATQEGGKR